MNKKILFLTLFLSFVLGCATVYVKSPVYFPNGTPSKEVLEKLGQPQYQRTIVDENGSEYEIYRYKADALFDLYRPTIFYNRKSIESVPSDIVFKDGLLILEGVKIQGDFFKEGKEAEAELLRSIIWHLNLSKDKNRFRTSLFW